MNTARSFEVNRCMDCNSVLVFDSTSSQLKCQHCEQIDLAVLDSEQVEAEVTIKCDCGYNGKATMPAGEMQLAICPQCSNPCWVTFSDGTVAGTIPDVPAPKCVSDILPAPKRHMAPIESECIDNAFCDLMAADNMLEIASDGQRHMFTDEMTEMRRDIGTLAYRILDLHNRYRQFGGKPLSDYGISFVREMHNEASQHKA